MSRFQGFPCPEGMLVLDTLTGEVVRIPHDGSAPVMLRKGLATAELLAPRDDAKSGDKEREKSASIVPSSATSLDQEVIATFPYPVARTWLAFFQERDPRQQCKLLVDTFTALLKLWAIQLSCEYFEAAGLKDVTVNDTLTRDLQRPLISAWHLMVHRTLPVLRDAGVRLFAPELHDAYESLETKCADRVLVRARYEDEEGKPRYRESKLGKIVALIRYRNGLAHGYNQSREKAQEDLDLHLPVLRDVLKASRFLTRYPLFAALGREPGNAYRLMGAWPPQAPEDLGAFDFDPEESPVFLFDEVRRDALPLRFFARMDRLESGREAVAGTGVDLVLFEGNTKSTIIYSSIQGEQIEKQTPIRSYRALVERKRVEIESVTHSSMTFDSLFRAAKRQTETALSALVASGRFLPEASIERTSAKDKLDQFEHGDYRGLVIGGASGIGKSTFLASMATRALAAGDVVLFYRGSNVADPDISWRIVRDLGVRNAHLEDVLLGADELVKGGRRLRIFVDAVNEYPGDTAALVRSLDAIVRQADSFPWFRMIASVRTAAYERLPSDARFGRLEGTRYLEFPTQRAEGPATSVLYELSPLSEGELESAYEAYRAYRRREAEAEETEVTHPFRPENAFAELHADGSTRALMKNPLMMRILMAAFTRRTLPSEVSFDDAMALYLDHVVAEKDNPRGAYPERRAFLKNLVRVLDRVGTASVSRDALYGDDRLRGALTNTQRDSPYVQLLELGVLVEDWESDRCMVRFAFEGLLEYLLAELHDPRIESTDDLVAFAQRSVQFRTLRGAAIIVIRRALLQGRTSIVLDALDRRNAPAEERASEPERREGASAVLVTMVCDVLADLGRFGEPKFDEFVEATIKIPSPSDVRMLLDVFDRLYVHAELAAAERAARAALVSAESLEVTSGQAAALLRLGLVERHRGRVDAALALLDRARTLARDANDELRQHRIDLQLADLTLLRGDATGAVALYEKAHAGLSALSAWGEASEALRGLATVKRRAGDLKEAERLTREAIAASERANDRVATAKGLNNLGMIHTERGDIDHAENAFVRAIAIKREIGDRLSLGVSQMNLGALYFGNMGDIARAEATWSAAKELCEDIGDQRSIAMVSANLGILYAAKREFPRAIECLEAACKSFRSMGDRHYLAHVLWYRASVGLDAGEEVTPWIEEHAELAKDGRHAYAPLHHRILMLRVAVKAGDRANVDRYLAEIEGRLATTTPRTVEDGPASAYVDAARFELAHNDPHRAHELLTKAHDLSRGKPFTRRAELDELLRDTERAIELAPQA